MPRSATLLLAGLVTLLLAGALVATILLRRDGQDSTPAAAPAARPDIVIGGKQRRARQAGDRNRARPVSVAQLERAELAARRFLDGYLPFIYGRGRVDEIEQADPRLLAALARQRGRITPAQHQREPRIRALTLVGQAARAVQATAEIKDSDAPAYPVIFYLDRTAGADWVVTRLGDD